MDSGDADRVASALAARIGALTFLDRTADDVTATLIDAVAAWAAAEGWRVYRRARSVVPLPPPYENRFSTLDVACARPAGPPVVIEVDRTDRRRTVEKLLAEAAVGRIAIWLRWGSGAIAEPPARSGVGGRRFDRTVTRERPPPRHSTGGTPTGVQPLA